MTMKATFSVRLGWVLLSLGLAACATPGGERNPGKVVDRLPGDNPIVATPAPPPPPRVELADLIKLAKEGLPAESLIARLKAGHTTHRLTASQVLELKTAGVPLPVIDYLLDSDRQLAQDYCAGELAKRDAEARAAIQQTELIAWQRCNLSSSPFGWPRSPFRRWP